VGPAEQTKDQQREKTDLVLDLSCLAEVELSSASRSTGRSSKIISHSETGARRFGGGGNPTWLSRNPFVTNKAERSCFQASTLQFFRCGSRHGYIARRATMTLAADERACVHVTNGI
jgi:hypothetical protein